jgi:hypothetical protein
VGYSTYDLEAWAGEDYTERTGVLTFAPGVLTQTVTISVTDDLVAEAEETLVLDLHAALHATLGNTTAVTITIVDDDDPATAAEAPLPPLVQFSAPHRSVGESAGSVPVTVTLDMPTTEPVTVSVVSSAGSAQEWHDYDPLDAVLVFAPGEITQTVALAVTDDTEAEHEETLHLELVDPIAADLGRYAYQTVSIRDDDTLNSSDPLTVTVPTVQFAHATTAVAEDVGTTPVTVTLSAATTLTVTVEMTRTAVARAGVPVVTLPGQWVTFAPGEVQQTIPLTITNDAEAGGDTVVELLLQHPVNATAGQPAHTRLTITDDDLATVSKTGGVVFLPLIRTGSSEASQ